MQPQGGVKVKKEVNENSKPLKTPEPAKKKKNTEQTPKKEPHKTPLQQKQYKTPLVTQFALFFKSYNFSTAP